MSETGTLIPQTTQERHLALFLEPHGHSSKVPKDRDFTLHFKRYLLFFISVIVEMQTNKHTKKKQSHFVRHALKTVSRCHEPRRRDLADLCLWGGGLSRCTAGVGERILGSEKDTSSPNHNGCILQFDVVLQDVCGNVHLHCGICSNIFLLASRYNKKKR